jgi:hypothetical protein
MTLFPCKAMVLAAATALTAASFALTAAHANTVWDFSIPTGDQGLSHVYTGDDGTSQITAFRPCCRMYAQHYHDLPAPVWKSQWGR